LRQHDGWALPEPLVENLAVPRLLGLRDAAREPEQYGDIRARMLTPTTQFFGTQY
jgi:hypothetical protein